MIKLLKHEHSDPHWYRHSRLHAYQIISVPACEVTLSEIATYGKDENVGIEFEGECVHIIKCEY